MSLEKLLQDESFKAAVGNVKSLDELYALIKGYDIEVSKEELEETLFNVSTEGDLDEASLEKINAGAPIGILLRNFLKNTIKRISSLGGGSGASGDGKIGGR